MYTHSNASYRVSDNNVRSTAKHFENEPIQMQVIRYETNVSTGILIMHIIPSLYIPKSVSSVLNRDVKQHGKTFMFDDLEDTAWYSDQVRITKTKMILLFFASPLSRGRQIRGLLLPNDNFSIVGSAATN